MELEARLAAKTFNYKWEEFCDLDGWEQSATVAAYRIDQQIEAIAIKRSNSKTGS